MKNYRCYQINDEEPLPGDDGDPTGTYFEHSILAHANTAPSLSRSDYDYIVIINRDEYKLYPFGNQRCSQGYRHKPTGWTFPDLCRQQGGCPEIWNRSTRKQLTVAPNSPIFDYF